MKNALLLVAALLGAGAGSLVTYIILDEEPSMHSGDRMHAAERLRLTCYAAYLTLQSDSTTDEEAAAVARVAQLCAGSYERAGEFEIGKYIRGSAPEDLKRARQQALEAFETGLGTAKRLNQWGEVVERYP